MKRQNSLDRPSIIDRFRSCLFLFCGLAAVYAVFSLWQLYLAATSTPNPIGHSLVSRDSSNELPIELDTQNGIWTFAGFEWELVVLNSERVAALKLDAEVEFWQTRSPAPLSAEHSKIFDGLRPFASRDIAVGNMGLRALGFSHGNTELVVLAIASETDGRPPQWRLQGVILKMADNSNESGLPSRSLVFRPAKSRDGLEVATLFPATARANSLAKRATLDGVALLEIAIIDGEFHWLQPFQIGGSASIRGFEEIGFQTVNGSRVEYFLLPNSGEKKIVLAINRQPECGVKGSF